MSLPLSDDYVMERLMAVKTAELVHAHSPLVPMSVSQPVFGVTIWHGGAYATREYAIEYLAALEQELEDDAPY